MNRNLLLLLLLLLLLPCFRRLFVIVVTTNAGSFELPTSTATSRKLSNWCASTSDSARLANEWCAMPTFSVVDCETTPRTRLGT